MTYLEYIHSMYFLHSPPSKTSIKSKFIISSHFLKARHSPRYVKAQEYLHVLLIHPHKVLKAPRLAYFRHPRSRKSENRERYNSTQTYHCILFGPSSTLGATFLNFFLNIPTFCIAAPIFFGKFAAICFRTILASFGPLPFVLTMICNGPSRCTLPK